jgi:hypothetical protein
MPDRHQVSAFYVSGAGLRFCQRFEHSTDRDFVATKNYFIPLRSMEVDEGKSTGKGTQSEPPTQPQTTAGSKGIGKSPPIILTPTLSQSFEISSGDEGYHKW